MKAVKEIAKDYTCQVTVGFIYEDEWHTATVYCQHDGKAMVFIKKTKDFEDDTIVLNFPAPKGLAHTLPLDTYSRILVNSAESELLKKELM